MGRPPHADGQRTRQAIIDAALKLFAENGYFGTSLRDIAKVVGVRESALYNYFPSKKALFEALIFADHQSKVERLSAVIEDPIVDVRVTLTRLALLMLESFSTRRQQQIFCMLMSDGIRLAKEGRINLLERLSSGQARFEALMRRLVRSGWLRGADPRLLAMEFMGPLVLWRQLHAIGSELPAIRNPRAFARRHVDQFLQGAGAGQNRSLRARGNKRVHSSRHSENRRPSRLRFALPR